MSRSLGDGLRRIRRGLRLGVGAYSAGDASANWADPDDLEGRGNTIRLDRVLGDLSFNFGAGGNGASLADVVAGQATLLDLNPFEELSLQFDLTVLGQEPTRRDGGVVVLRMRGAYAGAFDGLSSDRSTEDHTELGLSLGLRW